MIEICKWHIHSHIFILHGIIFRAAAGAAADAAAAAVQQHSATGGRRGLISLCFAFIS